MIRRERGRENEASIQEGIERRFIAGYNGLWLQVSRKELREARVPLNPAGRLQVSRKELRAIAAMIMPSPSMAPSIQEGIESRVRRKL